MDISSELLTDVFCSQFDDMNDNAQAEVVEAMVEHVETCDEASSKHCGVSCAFLWHLTTGVNASLERRYSKNRSQSRASEGTLNLVMLVLDWKLLSQFREVACYR